MPQRRCLGVLFLIGDLLISGTLRFEVISPGIGWDGDEVIGDGGE